MTIRERSEKELHAIAEHEKDCFSDPWSEQSITETFRSPAFKGFVAEDENGCVAGYSGVLVCFDAEIALIAVSPEKRRKGLGRLLLAAATDYATSAGAENIFLEVRTGNEPAKSLYESFGFIPVTVRKRYYEDGEDAIVMVKPKKLV